MKIVQILKELFIIDESVNNQNEQEKMVTLMRWGLSN
jgi:hypothetical protein